MPNQHLIDYTVRNITTGDEEDIRVLELEPSEIDGFPPEVRVEIAELIVGAAVEYRAGNSLSARVNWGERSERIRQLLLPYISDRALYDADYTAWENNVLDDAYGEMVQ